MQTTAQKVDKPLKPKTKLYAHQLKTIESS